MCAQSSADSVVGGQKNIGSLDQVRCSRRKLTRDMTEACVEHVLWKNSTCVHFCKKDSKARKLAVCAADFDSVSAGSLTVDVSSALS